MGDFAIEGNLNAVLGDAVDDFDGAIRTAGLVEAVILDPEFANFAFTILFIGALDGGLGAGEDFGSFDGFLSMEGDGAVGERLTDEHEAVNFLRTIDGDALTFFGDTSTQFSDST